MDVGFENGTIKLDHPKGIFYPGQILTGSIEFRLAQQAGVTAINIQYVGEARVLWTEHETQQRNGRSIETQVEYKAQEQYFNIAQCLYGGQGVAQLNAGPHAIPFQFQIPHTVPSSFRGEKGEVAYEIRASMEYPEQGRLCSQVLKQFFTVVAPIDLNMEDPEIAQPQKLEFEEVYSCGCACAPSPVTIDVGLPVAGFCPGQAVPVTVDVTNRANVEVKKIVLQIVTRTRYHSQRPLAKYTTPEEVLAAAGTKPVLSRTQRHYACHLPVPDMIAPNLNNCSIIDVGYFFKVVVKLSGCNDDIEDTLEIFIGQIPLHNFTNGQYVHPMAHSLPSGPIPEQPPILNTQANPNNAYPGYHSQPSSYPTAPALETGYPNPGLNNPNYQMGFKVDANVTNQAFAPVYPPQNVEYESQWANPMNGRTA